MYKITGDDSAMVGIDLMFALVLVIAVVIMAIQITPSLSHPTLSQEDRDWRIEQYMAAMRASDSLVQDEGEPGWEPKWALPDYLNVTKIGFVYVNADDKAIPKVLNETKIDAFMARYTDDGTGLPWWKFPKSSTDCYNTSQAKPERDNASRVLGLTEYKSTRYNFCMALHPVDKNLISLFNSEPVDYYLRNMTNITTASAVDRYVYIADPLVEDEIKYLKYNGTAVHYRLNLWVWS